MANIASNRSPSPLSSRTSKNSEASSSIRRSFNGNPFARPTAFTNPRSFNPSTPANSPVTTTDLTKRHSIARKSIGNSNSMFQDGKENLKDSIRSPAKSGTKSFMTPTISAASKFTPSPRKKVLGEKNEDLARTSIQFLTKEPDLDKAKQKEVVFETNPVSEVITFDSSESLSSEVTENCDLVNVVESSPKIVRPFCCSPQSSPVIPSIDDDPSLLPYDPKKNFLSPRPQFLHYKPNPRTEVLLNKLGGDDDCKDDNVTGFDLEDGFSSDTEVEEEEEDEEEEEKKEGVDEEEETQIGDSMESSVLVEKTDFEIKKTSKTSFFTRSRTVCLLSLMFLMVCFSVSLTDNPPMDLPIYKDVSFSEIYHESLRFSVFAKQSFDDLVENVKEWLVDLVSYHFSSSDHEISSIQFFNLTISPPHDDFLFEELQETEVFEEKSYESEVDEAGNEEDEVEIEESNEVLQSENDDSDSLQTSFDLEDESTEVKPGVKSVKVGSALEIESGLSESVLEDSSETITQSETVKNDLEMESGLSNSEAIPESEALGSFLTRSFSTISMAALSVLLMAASIIIYKKSKARARARAEPVQTLSDTNERRESCSSGTSSVYKKKPRTSGNKRESMASSSSDFSMGSGSYGSFTTFERIPIKKGEEMLTPIRRSSRLMKNQVTSS